MPDAVEPAAVTRNPMRGVKRRLAKICAVISEHSCGDEASIRWRPVKLRRRDLKHPQLPSDLLSPAISGASLLVPVW